MSKDAAATNRETVFISKATPEDDEFVLWLAPRLEAAGYQVFADVRCLEPGDRWRKVVTSNLQQNAIKMLLCCRDSTLDKNGVQEEIGMAEDLAKQLKDSRFIIPLRLEKYKKIFGIGELQYINFVGSWAKGLRDLLEALDTQGVPRSASPVINPDWENYKKRLAVKVEKSPEVLTSSWLRVASVPDRIRYYRPPGAIDHSRMELTCKSCAFPAEIYLRGFFTFASQEEVDAAFSDVGKFVHTADCSLTDFLEKGAESPKIRSREAQNLVLSMYRRSWEGFCASKGLYRYLFSSQFSFHVTADQVSLGKKISLSRYGSRRSAMLRNVSKGKVWQYGISATPHCWPFHHFRIKSRVLFAPLEGKEAGKVFDDAQEQHRLRRSVCKGWRNKTWHQRMLAYLELLSGQAEEFELPLAAGCSLTLKATPVRVTAPVTAKLPDTMSEDSEEQDESTLGNFNIEGDDGAT